MASAVTAETPLDAIYAEYLPKENPEVSTKKKRKKKLTAAEKMKLKLKEEQDFKILEMRDLMRREYEMSQKTARKYRERWEKMCRDVKMKEMKKELEDWEDKVNRVIKQKDEKIELILDEIAITKEIQKKNFSNQLQMMDYLMDVWKAFQQASQVLYENETSEILHNFYRECDERNAVANSIRLNAESMIHATAALTEQEMLSDYKIFLEKHDDHVNTEIEKRYRLRDAIVKQMEQLRKQLLEFLNSLLNVSFDAKKYERINSLTERQRNFFTDSVKLNSMEAKSTHVYADLQHLIAQEERVANRKLKDLKLEHEYFLQIRKKIEKEMKQDREQTHERLKIITSESFKVLKKYEKLLKFGELLLSLAATCRKYQTESEKVLPWGDFQEPRGESETDSEPFKLETIDLKEHVDISEAQLQTNANLMRIFWRRQAVVEAEIVLLEEKKLQLQNENQNYIVKIKRLSKSDNVEDLKASLLVKKVL